MCKFKSFVVTDKLEVFWLKYEDSHEKIIREYKLDDTRNSICRVEISPTGSLSSTNTDDWEIKVDEEAIPEWYTENKAFLEDKMLQVVVNEVVPLLVDYEGSLDLEGTQIKDLGNLQSVGGWLDLSGTQIKDLGNLQSVGENLYLSGTQIKDLGNLQSIGASLDLSGTQIKDLGNLQSVGENLWLQGTQVKDLGNLQRVGGGLWLQGTQVKDLGNVNVGRGIYR